MHTTIRSNCCQWIVLSKGFLPLFFFFFTATNMLGQEETKPTIKIKPYNIGQTFTCITPDSSWNIWAGTKKEGLHFFNQKKNALLFDKINVENGNFTLSDFNIQSIAASPIGDDLWVGHEGTGGFLAPQGGVEQVNINFPEFESQHYRPDSDSKCFFFPHLEKDGLPTRNITSITVDHLGTVWTAHKRHQTENVFFPGGMAYKRKYDEVFTPKGTWRHRDEYPELPYPAYTCGDEITKTPQTRTFPSIANSKKEVWASSFPYEDIDEVVHPARILRYDLAGNYLGEDITLESVGLPEGSFGVFNGIYLTKACGAWVTISGGRGFAVRKEEGDQWELFDSGRLPDVIVDGLRFSDNAIWGNEYGEVFMGTNKGLIVFDAFSDIDDVDSYHLYTAEADNLISDVIEGGYSERDTVQWIATDNGIMRLVLGAASDYDNDEVVNQEPAYKDCEMTDHYEHIDFIEHGDALSKGKSSYHIYTIETEICRTDGPNGQNCTVENVAELIKNQIGLNAPIPADFPEDNLTLPFLNLLTEGEVKNIEQTINFWEPNITEENPSGRIEKIKQVAPFIKGQLTHIDATPNPQHIALFKTLDYLEHRNEDYYDNLNETLNPDPKAESCKRYNLVTNSNTSLRNFLFDITFDHLCGNLMENPLYQPIVFVMDEDNYQFTNYTILGHLLYPGKVTRTLKKDCNSVKMVSVGEGTQYCNDVEVKIQYLGGDLIKVNLGKLNARGNVITGSILFKNIDLRLKKAFEEEG